jgi:D-alanyl-D-alanine carboxypeptidase
MVDGSGLSRKNLVTAKQFVCILQQMKKSDLFPIFFESLPQQVNIIKAKSGSMSLINGYVGYSGNIAFAILVNQCMDQKQMHEKIKSILNNLDQLSQKSKE